MANTVIVVPCYNEADRLDVEQFRRFIAAGRPQRFLLVNDGSQDATLEILRRMCSDDPRHFDLLDIPENSGKAEATRRGILWAMDWGADYVGFWDADLATPLEEIPKFCDILDRRPEIEIVVGTRLPLLGRVIERRPLRHLLGRLFAKVASTTLGMRIYDTQCGAKLFRSSSAMQAVFAHPFLARWIFDVEILARLDYTRRGTDLPDIRHVVYESPLERWEDVAGSKLKKGDFVKAAMELAIIYWRYLRPGLSRPVASPTPAAGQIEKSEPSRRAA